MENENKELFDDVNKDFGTPKENQTQVNAFDATDSVEEDDMESTPTEIEGDFELGEMSSQTKLEVQLKDNDGADNDNEGKTFIIENAELVKPRTRDADGNFIEPIVFNPKKPDQKGYVTKLKITYKDSDYISLIPNIKWYVSSAVKGKKTLNPWFATQITEDKLTDNFTSAISKLYFRFCTKHGYEVGKVPAAQFIKELPGKAVKLEQWQTTFEGAERFRIDIKEFV